MADSFIEHNTSSVGTEKGKEPGFHLGYVFKDIISRKFYLDAVHFAGILGYGSGDVRASIASTAKACYPSGYNG